MRDVTQDEAVEAVRQGQIVVARYSTGDIAGEGKVIAYSLVPTVTIECRDGTRFSWRHDMVTAHPPTP